MSVFAEIYSPLDRKADLSFSEAEALMRFLIGGAAQEKEILQILNAMCDKGPTETEIVAFATVMRSKGSMLLHPFTDLVDTCGTGGGRPTFNISTAAALVAAGAGVKVAKHGNRSTTGMGSADVLECLGLRLGASSEELVHQIDTVGVAFLFAQAHHPAMRHVASARKLLGRRSFFNLLGPLANPAGARRQLIGVYDPELLDLMANSLRRMHTERAVLVHSTDGLDEISPCAETQAVLLSETALETKLIQPEDFGVKRLDFSQIRPGNTLQESANFLLESISNGASPRSHAIIPSAATAIWLGGLEPNFSAAADRARASISEGYALKKLNQLIGTAIQA
jgi:anthranilate phosphoribosyltransferase